MGKCKEGEEQEHQIRRVYMRIKVEMNNEEPLLAGFRWKNSKGQEKWAEIKYERLSGICYDYGMIGHASQ